MKHYVLTFVGQEYDIWVFRARFAEDSDMSVAELPISIDHQKITVFCARSIGRLSELI